MKFTLKMTAELNKTALTAVRLVVVLYLSIGLHDQFNIAPVVDAGARPPLADLQAPDSGERGGRTSLSPVLVREPPGDIQYR